MKKLLKLSLLSIIASGSLFASTYSIDKSHSEVGFKVKHMMIYNVSGNFKEFNGTFDFDKKTNSLKSLEGTISVSSISTDNDKRDEHLRSSDLFDVEKYENISFKTTKIEKNKIYGDFTMKGITKNISLDLENGGTIKDLYGNERAGFSLKGKIKRSDFNLTWNKTLETGGVAVGEEVSLNIDIEGILK